MNAETLPPTTRNGMREYISMFTGEGSGHVDFWLDSKLSKYGLTEEDVYYFKNNDIELKAAIDKFTGIDFPLKTIDGSLIIELAGMVQKLGSEGAISEARKWPRRVRALIRAICRKHKSEVRRI